MNVLRFLLATTLAATACSLSPRLLAADESPGPYKLTLGHYQFSGCAVGWDLNLRRSVDQGNVWLGYFDLADEHTRQWRTGWDDSFGEKVRIAPSLQMASGGFVGGSLQAEIGDPWFASVGLGRTNLHPYWNLNFDPNDAYMLTAGRRLEGQTLMLQWIRDNRQNPDQQHLHFYLRQTVGNGERITVDALYKTGLVEDRMIHRWGLTLAYDWPAFFVRVAWDPNTNFTPDDVLRFSIGTRF